MQLLKRLLLRLYGVALKSLGERPVTAFLVGSSAALARVLPAKRSLRFLLDLDNHLYSCQGEAAVRYDDGLHVKHRLTRYHDFFVEKIAGGQKVLDIGCGHGAVAYSVASRTGAAVIGIDHNQEKISQARSRYVLPNLEFVCGDAFTDLPEHGFAVAILSNVLEHFDRRPEFLQAIRQRISPEMLLVRVPMFERDWRVAAKQELDLEWRLDATHHIEYDLQTFQKEVSQGGYWIAECDIRWGEIWAVLREAKS